MPGMGTGSAVRRFVVTGAPGAGKTTILAELRELGFAVVEESATDVIARQQAIGVELPWNSPGFVEAIARQQCERLAAPVADGAGVQLFDRSLICTLALARYGEVTPPPFLAEAVERVLKDGTYQRRVLFVRLLGFVTPTAARRISYADSVRFERIHEDVYRDLGFELVDVPPAPLADRVELVRSVVTDRE
jgi:predicted ATPase